jgi:hypothetical protein
VLGRFDPAEVLAAIERWKIQILVMVPTHFVRLAELPNEVRARYDLSSLVLVVHTGSATTWPRPAPRTWSRGSSPSARSATSMTRASSTSPTGSPTWSSWTLAVEISMVGTGHSLNVAVAGSLVLFKLAGLL